MAGGARASRRGGGPGGCRLPRESSATLCHERRARASAMHACPLRDDRPPTTMIGARGDGGPRVRGRWWCRACSNSTLLERGPRAASAAICRNTVSVPCPMSVEAVRMRSVRRRSRRSIRTLPLSRRSPEPVKPAPCMKRLAPMPRRTREPVSRLRRRPRGALRRDVVARGHRRARRTRPPPTLPRPASARSPSPSRPSSPRRA